MPELPEVEITRRHLEAVLTGRALETVELRHDRTARHNTSREEVVARLLGRRVLSVGRHGKFLRIALDDGQVMVAHLGMSGRWSVNGDDSIPHTHFVATLDDGTRIAFVDPRTFGFVAVYDEDELGESGLSRLGPDAWAEPPSPEELAARLAGKTAPIKALLLDQGPLAGLGNIYADEVLFLAGIHPLTPGGGLSEQDCARLLDAVSEVLTGAIEHGGTTLSDLAYLLPDGAAGENMTRLRVYGREGESCDVCGAPIERVVVRARSTHFCPNCQAMR
ncbi:MAG TPA: bifunctional DNA-formamidopyrimidine glycosylase/DNA-(apurinic or apyrimidinic site) lyase [Acidimicrobiia bacterium]|nr:bifunctional DNA-formamidopyrimidine glycosylase/DNA-(apurinic or apyrimidinic site) lyase [Acidimicrobiia bacterium]